MNTKAERVLRYADYYQGLFKIYFDWILEILIKIGDLRSEQGLILDYGCGYGYLKKRLKTWVIGYDIIPELSDVPDYRVLKPAQIVLNNVLEHLYPEEIKNLLLDFEKMNPEAVLLVCLPTENWLAKAIIRLLNYKDAHEGHVTGYREISKILEKKYYPWKRRFIFFGLAQVAKYIPIQSLQEKK
ncbi:MAG: hypothetical protein WCW25_03715 [Patescibacteria group bacterium]